MTATLPSDFGTSPFLPTTQYFDASEPKPLSERLEVTYADTAKAINQRDISIYDFPEGPNGQIWFGTTDTSPKRSGFRRTYYIPTLGNFPGVTTQAHAISTADLANIIITKFQAVSSKFTAPATFLSAPIIGDGVNSINMWMDGTNINLAATSNVFDGFQVVIVLEYIIGT